MKDDRQKVNLLIVEPDNTTFDRLKQDLKMYSPFVNRIYHYSLHDDIFSDNYWRNCQLILAHNADDVGLMFFKRFYYEQYKKKTGHEKKEDKKRIYGLIHTAGQENELPFYRIARYLHEWSDGLFLGVIYKRFGSLEKILEIIRNLALTKRVYPIFDWLQNERKKPAINTSKLEVFRSIHSTKYNIVSKMQPMVNLLRQFNDEQKIELLFESIGKHSSYLRTLNSQKDELQQDIEKFLQLRLKGRKLDAKTGQITETSNHVKEVKKFFSLDSQQNNGLAEYLNLFSHISSNNKGVVSALESKAKNGSIDLFLREYNSFIQALNKLANLLDEDCMFSK